MTSLLSLQETYSGQVSFPQSQSPEAAQYSSTTTAQESRICRESSLYRPAIASKWSLPAPLTLSQSSKFACTPIDGRAAARVAKTAAHAITGTAKLARVWKWSWLTISSKRYPSKSFSTFSTTARHRTIASGPTTTTNAHSRESRNCTVSTSSPATGRNANSAVTRNATSAIARNANSAVTRNATSAIARNAASAITRNATSAIARNAASAITRNAASAITRNADSAIARNAASAVFWSRD